MTTTTLDSPLGPLRAVADGDTLVRLAWPHEPVGAAREDAAPFRDLRDWLDAYFAGRAAPYGGPVAPAGTPFQQRVWALLREIPHGTTTTYGALATRLGDPKAVRAVGAANGRNPIAIVVPCHRVVGADGALTGFAGGLDAKRFLLALEAPGLFAPLTA